MFLESLPSKLRNVSIEDLHSPLSRFTLCPRFIPAGFFEEILPAAVTKIRKLETGGSVVCIEVSDAFLTSTEKKKSLASSPGLMSVFTALPHATEGGVDGRSMRPATDSTCGTPSHPEHS